MKCNPWVGGSIGRRGFPMLGNGKRGLSTYVKELFKKGEQGFFYDPNDLSTMFQDAAGTVPVTGAGQPVGLVLDKSKGLALGPELVANGTFDANINGWSVIPTATAMWTPAGILISRAGARFVDQAASQINLVSGKSYLVSLEVTVAPSAGNASLGIFGSDRTTERTVAATVSFNTAKKFSFVFTASVTETAYVIAGIAGATQGTVTFDNISVRELSGNHAYQTTSASRPILRQNATTGANYLEFDGTDDFLRTNNIDFTGTDKMNLFAGVRKLSDEKFSVVFEFSSDWTSKEGSFVMHAPYTNGGPNFYNGSRGTANATILLASTISGTPYAAPASAVVSAKHDISGNYSMMLVNGNRGSVATGDKGTGNFGNHPIYIGRRAGNSSPFNGHIYSLIGVGKLVSDDETLAIEKELAKRLGVNLNV